MKDLNKVLLRDLREVVLRYMDAAKQQVRLEWSMAGHNELGDSYIKGETEKIMDGTVVYNLIAHGQRAWILEYGRGSLMATEDENPFLDAYKRSEYWNPVRAGTAITGRENGDYFDLDGNIHHSNGNLAGQDIEHWVHHNKKEPDKIDENYLPLPALKIIHNVLWGSGNDGYIRQMIDEMKSVINRDAFQIVTQSLSKELKITL